ncbi:hypothetical protein Tco_0256992, partial [Tanacetum coccineum]
MSQPANDDFSQHLSDDEASYHEDASENGTATNKPKQQQQLIPTTTTILNIKLPILKKEEYDIWAMEMEHYLEYIDNDVWKVIQNGNSKKRISTGKDGVVRILPPVSAAEIHAVEKERKARTILLMAIPKEHLRRFHGMDDAKEIWEAIRTRFGGNANSKKMQKAVLKQQFEAFTISSSEGLEKGYDRFQQLLSQLEAHGAEVSTEDANHKFLRSLPPAWSNLAMTMRTKPDVDTLSIDDLYNNLRVFEQELTSTSKSSASAQNVAFVSHSKSSTNKVKSGHTGAYSTYTPTSSNNIQEREVPAGFADEVIYSLFAKQSEDLDLLHEDLEQIDDVDIEEMDINWQIAMIAIRMKKFYKKTGSYGISKQEGSHSSVQSIMETYQDIGTHLSRLCAWPEEAVSMQPPSPDYVPVDQWIGPGGDDDEGLGGSIRLSADGGDDGDDEMDIEEDEDADMDIDADEEDEDDKMDVEIDDEAEEEATQLCSPVLRFFVFALPATAQITIPEPLPVPAWSDSEVARLLAISSLPASPLSPWSSSPPQIPFPLSPPSPVLTAPPPSPIRSLGYRAATIRMRAEAAATSHSLPLPPPFILSPTRPDAPPPLPTSAPTSFPPLLLPSDRQKEDIPEVNLPPRMGLGIALGPRYEVGESSTAAAARPAGGFDYGFVATMDREIRRDPERYVGYGITDSWDEIVETLQG